MDCAAEEQLIRIKLARIQGIAHLEFDLANRKLLVLHSGQLAAIEKSILKQNLGGQKLSSESSEQSAFRTNANQKKTLLIILLINFGFFILEMTAGILSKSMGLVADSLDMLAEAFVYGMSLFAVGGTLSKKKRIAKLAGYVQIALATLGFFEVWSRFFGVERWLNASTMVIVSILPSSRTVFACTSFKNLKIKQTHTCKRA